MKVRKLLYSAVLFLSINLLSLAALANDHINANIIEKVRKGIVTIETRVSLSAYGAINQWSGTGFIADKKNGFIITNGHVVGEASIGNYFVTFHDGKLLEAKLIYYDIYRDFAILKVHDMPNNTEQINFSKLPVAENQFAFIVGNNGGQGFSFHPGYLADVYDISGRLPSHSYIVNLNSAGGSSGSPLLNKSGECIGLNYAGYRTYAIVLNAKYITDVFNAIKEGKEVVRKSAGVIYNSYSIDKAMKHRAFPEHLAEEYVKKFPNVRNRVLVVHSVLPSVKTTLKAGDIILKVDGKDVGASLYDLDNIIDYSKDNKIKFTIVSQGVKKEVVMDLYNVDDYKVKKMVLFGGATFFETDDYSSKISGIPLGGLAVFNVQSGSSFGSIEQAFYNENNKFYRMNIKYINDNAVNNIEDLIKVLPKFKENKSLNVEYINHMPYMVYSGIYSSCQQELIQDLVLDQVGSIPRIFSFNHEKNEWIEDKQ